MTKEDYMRLPKERLAELLELRDKADEVNREFMSKRAKEASLREYPPSYSEVNRNAKRIQSYKVDTHKPIRQIYIKGYEQAEKDTIERACQLLYDYNKQMAEIFGAKAVLSCNQFTIDVKRFRKTLIMR